MENAKMLQFRMAVPADTDCVISIVRRAVIHMRQQGIEQWEEMYPTKEILAQDIQNHHMYVGVLSQRIVLLYVINQACDAAYVNGRLRIPGA